MRYGHEMSNTVQDKLASYSPVVREKIEAVRGLIFAVAQQQQLGEITESLKWGELSYVCKHGSPIRLNWKDKSPEQISVYFNCNTILVETFREIFGDRLNLVGNRELVLPLDTAIPEPELTTCFAMALQYHTRKKQPLLGA